MDFRKSRLEDIKDIMEIIKQAQDFFRENEINQWQNNYPNSKIIEDDIKKNHSYVLTDNNNIIATVALSFDRESTYDKIYEGKWLTNDKYAVIHRIAVDSNLRGTGIAREIINETEKITKAKSIYSIKIDTHRDNKSMIKFLEKNNFIYCGIIYLKDGNERLAFEKKIL